MDQRVFVLPGEEKRAGDGHVGPTQCPLPALSPWAWAGQCEGISEWKNTVFHFLVCRLGKLRIRYASLRPANCQSRRATEAERCPGDEHEDSLTREQGSGHTIREYGISSISS